MSNVLLLTADEKKTFDALSAPLKEGWKTQNETITTYERPDELFMRYKIAHFNDPACKALATAARSATSAKDFEKIAGTFDITKVSQEQMAELFFVLGTRVISAMLASLLAKAKDDEDMEGIAGLTAIRRMLIESNAS